MKERRPQRAALFCAQFEPNQKAASLERLTAYIKTILLQRTFLRSK
jgi:hypothetical protein